MIAAPLMLIALRPPGSVGAGKRFGESMLGFYPKELHNHLGVVLGIIALIAIPVAVAGIGDPGSHGGL